MCSIAQCQFRDDSLMGVENTVKRYTPSHKTVGLTTKIIGRTEVYINKNEERLEQIPKFEEEYTFKIGVYNALKKEMKNHFK